ncbi:hypothetical protein MBLNU13_g04225t1 [Cladosporium sp. NU13]
MSGVSSTWSLEQSLLKFLKEHHLNELECSGSRRLEARERQASHGYHELVTKISNALSDLYGLCGTSDGTNAMAIPECMQRRALCDLHHQLCLDFVCGSGGKALQDRHTEPFSPVTIPGLMSANMAAALDQDDGHKKLFDSHKYTDKSGQQLGGDVDEDSNDDLEDEMIEDLGGDSGDDENDEPSNIDALGLDEYDRQEVIQKDEVSQRCRQYIVDEDDVRTLLSFSDLEDRAGSMSDSMQSDTMIHADCTTPKSAAEHSSSSPFTPRNHPLFLRRSLDTHSARINLYTGQFHLSPNDRTLRTVTTLSADPSYDEPVELNEKAVRQLIMDADHSKSNSLAYAKAGYVYAFRDNELSLIKFGHTTDLKTRKADIERDCGFVKGITLVAAVNVKACKQLEDIIHQDLAPHRRFFDCKCGRFKRQKGFTRHQEWFQIDDNTASSTMQLWADFVERRPWSRKLSHRRGTHLKRRWHARLLASSKIEASETHESHDDRVKRWRELLNIPLPEVDLEGEVTEGTSTPLLTTRSTAQPLNGVAGVTESSTPDYTPSKPPRSGPEDITEADKSVKSNLLFSESAKRSSSPYEPTDRTHEQDPQSTVYSSSFSLPYRNKDGASIPDGTAASLQAKNTLNETTVPSGRKQSSLILPGLFKAQQNTDEQSERSQDEASSLMKSLPSGPIFATTPTVPKPSIDREPPCHTALSPVGSSRSGDNPGASTTPGRSAGIKQSEDEVASTVGGDIGKTHRTQSKDQPSDRVFSPLQKRPNNATVLSASPVVQSMSELARCLLAKDVRPLPARAISADIWQFRWPIACSIAFALHSPHIPAGLSFLMWSIFLPLFVAELRGWAIAG